MTVGIKTQTATKARLASKLLVRHRLKKNEEPLVYVVSFVKDASERKMLFLRGRLRVEGVNPSVFDGITQWCSAFQDRWQMLERFFFPCRDMRDDVAHGPPPGHTRFQEQFL